MSFATANFETRMSKKTYFGFVALYIVLCSVAIYMFFTLRDLQSAAGMGLLIFTGLQIFGILHLHSLGKELRVEMANYPSFLDRKPTAKPSWFGLSIASLIPSVAATSIFPAVIASMPASGNLSVGIVLPLAGCAFIPMLQPMKPKASSEVPQ